MIPLISKNQARDFALLIKNQVTAFVQQQKAQNKKIIFLHCAKMVLNINWFEEQRAEYEHDYHITYCEWLNKQVGVAI